MLRESQGGCQESDSLWWIHTRNWFVIFTSHIYLSFENTYLYYKRISYIVYLLGPPRHITHNQPSFLLVDNLPRISYGELYNRLDRMCDNTGGKIVNLERLMAVIKFSTLELCMRAQKRLNNHCLRPGLLPIRARFSPQTIKAFK